MFVEDLDSVPALYTAASFKELKLRFKLNSLLCNQIIRYTHKLYF